MAPAPAFAPVAVGQIPPPLDLSPNPPNPLDAPPPPPPGLVPARPPVLHHVPPPDSPLPDFQFPPQTGPQGMWTVDRGGPPVFHPFHGGQGPHHQLPVPQPHGPPFVPPHNAFPLPGFQLASGRAPYFPPPAAGSRPGGRSSAQAASGEMDLDAGESAAAASPQLNRPPRHRSTGIRLSSCVVVERIRARTRAPPRPMQLSSDVLVRLWHGRAFVEVVTNILECALGAMGDSAAEDCLMDAGRMDRCQLGVRDLVHKLECVLAVPGQEHGLGEVEAFALEQMGLMLQSASAPLFPPHFPCLFPPSLPASLSPSLSLQFCYFRYVSKYRHCDGKLVLKATDDRVCIKFRTDQAQDAKKMERLNNLLFTLMARGPDAVVESLSLEPQQLVSQQQQQQQQQARRGRGRRQ
ncbi:unnamed protein product [Closterium sp. Naga37s-1]|nr:unnamed protein product [Closterium sp. Naga37s-1]